MPQLLTRLDNFPPALRGGVVSVGNFDGIHRGHAELIARLVSTASRLGCPSVVMTFDPPPARLLFPDRPVQAPLTTIERRAELLFDLGVDAVWAYPTDSQILAQSAEDFFYQTLVGKLQVRAVVEGPNFRFGRNRAGDVTQLRKFCADAGVECAIVAAREAGEGMISSTRIRQLLIAGQIAEANQLLTHPFRLEGLVAPGAGRGRELGFATANLQQVASLLPGHGVYAGRVIERGDISRRPAAINLGPNPTFGEHATKVEIHIVDYNGDDLYGQRLCVELTRKIRDVQKFDSIDALRAQVALDVAACAAAIRVGS